MSRLRGTAKILFFSGFRAAPTLMCYALVLSIVNGFAVAFFPFGFKVFADGFVRREQTGMVVGATLSGLLIAVSWMASNLDAGVGYDLVDRVRLYMSTLVADLVNRVPTVEHFERPEYLQELDLIEWNRSFLASGPRVTLTSLQVAVRGLTMMALLVSVEPVLLALPLFALVPMIGERWAVKLKQRCEERLSERRRLADQLFALTASVGPAKEIRVFGLSEHLRGRHDELAAEIRSATLRAAFLGVVVSSAGWLVFVVGFLGGIALVIHEALLGRATAGQVVMTIIVGQQVRLFLQQAAGAFSQVLTTEQTARRLLWLEEFAANNCASGRSQIPLRLRTGIEFENVSFRYPGSNSDALSDINFAIPAGSTVAIVGENGAGKTTLTKLLLRMYDPTEGRITIEGLRLDALNQGEWRARVAGAFQDFVRFELHASEVIGVGDLPRIDDDHAIAQALKRSGGQDVVSSLRNGLHTELGSSHVDGAELSTGQWQKLALARGMMRDEPLLLVLDEPTSSLDAETEYQLFERLAAAARRTDAADGGVTVLVSHRFSTVRAADLILVLREGRLVEVGSHAELIGNRGLYAELYNLQASAYVS